MPLEELHGFLMLLRRRARLERAEVAALAGLGIFLARIEPVFAGSEFADHCSSANFLRLKYQIANLKTPTPVSTNTNTSKKMRES